jgi:multidrug resistance protein, MATE family
MLMQCLFRVRVANELGAGSARRAKFAIYNVVITSFLIGFVLFSLFLLFHGNLAYIFTESRAVANAVADLSPLLAFSILLNSVQPVLSGLVTNSTEVISTHHKRFACFTDVVT